MLAADATHRLVRRVSGGDPMTRRLTIARDGTVKLGGEATRWRVEPSLLVMRKVVVSPSGRWFWSLREARAYLATLTDEELRG